MRCELLEDEVHELYTTHYGNTLQVNFQVALLENFATLQLHHTVSGRDNTDLFLSCQLYFISTRISQSLEW